MEEKEITIEIKKPEVWFLLGFLVLIFVLEMQVVMDTKINFGDEGFHIKMAQYMAEEKEYPVWIPFEGYTKVGKLGFSRPALWNILEGSFIFIFGLNEFVIKLLVPLIVFLTGISVFILVKKLFNEKVAFIASIIAVTIPSFVTYSVLYYTDILFTFFMTLFFLLFLIGLKEGNKKYFLLSGIFAAFSLLTKIPGLAAYAIVFLMFLYEFLREKKLFPIFKKYLPLVLIMILIPSTWILRNWYFFGNPCYNPPYINIFDMSSCNIDNFQEKYQFVGRTEMTGTEQSVYTIGIVNYLNFAYGSLWFVVLAFFCGLFMLFFKRDLINNFIIISLVIFLLIFYVSTGRSEDTARYTLGWVPIIALVSATWFDEIYEFIKKYQKYLALVVFIFVLIFGFLNFNEKLNVMAQVKQFSPLFFEACDWIKQNTPKDILMMTVWGHRAVYNCQRNTVGDVPDIILSEDLNYTLSVAKQFGITHFFIQKFSLSTQALEENYPVDFVQFLENNSEHFKKIFENGPSLQQCVQQGGCDGNILYEIKF